MKHIRDLIIESATIAVNSNSSHITMPMLAKAYDKILNGNYEENPFLPGFEIDRAMEKHFR